VTIPVRLIRVTVENWRDRDDLEAAAHQREDDALITRLGLAER